MRRCPVCGELRPMMGAMCTPCGKSYDRATRRDDGTIQAVIEWAAARARWFERRRNNKTRRDQ